MVRSAAVLFVHRGRRGLVARVCWLSRYGETGVGVGALRLAMTVSILLNIYLVLRCLFNAVITHAPRCSGAVVNQC